MVKLKCAD